MKQEQNGKSEYEKVNAVVLPAWDDIDLVPIKQLHEAKIKAEKYVELLNRVIRYKLER